MSYYRFLKLNEKYIINIKDLKIIEQIIKTVKKNEPYKFTLSDNMIFIINLMPYFLQSYISNLFVKGYDYD